MGRILIADDSLFMRMMHRKTLEAHGHEVVGEAANGFETLAIYEEQKPDLTMLDITMPGMTGTECLRQLMKKDPKAKVVMVSSMGQEHFVRESIVLGAKAFVVKPAKERDLIAIVNKVLGV